MVIGFCIHLPREIEEQVMDVTVVVPDRLPTCVLLGTDTPLN